MQLVNLVLAATMLLVSAEVNAQEETTTGEHARHELSLLIAHTTVSQGINVDGERTWLSGKVGLGGELKWLNATEARNNVFSAQVMLQWRPLRW